MLPVEQDTSILEILFTGPREATVLEESKTARSQLGILRIGYASLPWPAGPGLEALQRANTLLQRGDNSKPSLYVFLFCVGLEIVRSDT